MAAAAPLTEDAPKTDTTGAPSSTTASTTPAPAPAPTQPANPTPVAQPPLAASNTLSMATESSQSSPPVTATQTAPDGRPLTAAEIADKARAQGAGAGASASLAANVAVGQQQQKTQAAATNAASNQAATAATAKGKAQAPAPSALDIQADALAKAPENIKKMLEGDDPIARVQFNQLINQVGPANQLTMEALGMRLRQQGLDGQGAGTALMAMMARDLDYNTNQLVANISADSAKRLYDLNQWGFSKAQEIAVQKTNTLRDNFNMAVKSGQWDVAASTWGELFPNIPFDANAAKALDPAVQEGFAQQSKIVQQLIDQGNPDGAKAAFLAMAKSNPQMFGYKTPEEAEAALSGIDFSKESWAKAQDFNAKVTEDIRTATLQGDRTSAMSAIDRYFENMAPGSAEKMGQSDLSSMSLDDINAVLKANGKAPIQSDQDKASLSSDTFAKDKMFADESAKAKGANGVDLLLKQVIDVHPEIGLDPKLHDAARAWLFDNVANLNVSPDGSSVSGYQFKEGAGLPPWDPNSVSSHLYMDWPQATFNDDGSLNQTLYQGDAPYSDEYKRGDLTTESGRNNATIDKNYEAYVMATRVNPDLRLNRQDWYYATKGGQQIQPLPQYAKTDSTGTTTARTVNDVFASVKSKGLASLTTDDKKLLDDSGLVPSFDIKTLASQNGSANAATEFANNSSSGMANVGGKLIRVLPEGGDYVNHTYTGSGAETEARFYSWVKVEVDGKQYKVDNRGNWFAGDAKLPTSSNGSNVDLPAMVTSPLGAQ